jgi:hypothetical protein
VVINLVCGQLISAARTPSIRAEWRSIMVEGSWNDMVLRLVGQIGFALRSCSASHVPRIRSRHPNVRRGLVKASTPVHVTIVMTWLIVHHQQCFVSVCATIWRQKEINHLEHTLRESLKRPADRSFYPQFDTLCKFSNATNREVCEEYCWEARLIYKHLFSFASASNLVNDPHPL